MRTAPSVIAAEPSDFPAGVPTENTEDSEVDFRGFRVFRGPTNPGLVGMSA
jgi:hypothetical protein